MYAATASTRTRPEAKSLHDTLISTRRFHRRAAYQDQESA